jgi:hypothetical protein
LRPRPLPQRDVEARGEYSMEANRPKINDLGGAKPEPYEHLFDANTLLLVYNLAQAKYTNKEISVVLGYPDNPPGLELFTKSVKEVPALAKALTDAREVADAVVAGQLFKNAVEAQDKHPFGQLEAQKAWLKASRTGRWQDRATLEVEGVIGATGGNPDIESRIAALLARKVKQLDL